MSYSEGVLRYSERGVVLRGKSQAILDGTLIHFLFFWALIELSATNSRIFRIKHEQKYTPHSFNSRCWEGKNLLQANLAS